MMSHVLSYILKAKKTKGNQGGYINVIFLHLVWGEWFIACQLWGGIYGICNDVEWNIGTLILKGKTVDNRMYRNATHMKRYLQLPKIQVYMWVFVIISSLLMGHLKHVHKFWELRKWCFVQWVSGLFFLMFQTNIIMAQDHINCLHNTKEHWLVFLGRTLCKLMGKLRPETGNPLEIFCLVSLYFINIMSSLCFKQILSRHRIRLIACTTQRRTS